MAGGSQISALHLAIAAGGGVLLYAAFQDMTPLEALKELTSGKKPKAIEDKKSSLSMGSGASRTSYGGAGAASGSLTSAAKKYLGVPYVWGGTSPKGLDCSGLVVLSFQDAYGVTPPRTTYVQETWKQLQDIPRGKLVADDLVFWPGHVAIYVGDGNVIHAPRPGRNVTIAKLDQAGPTGVRPSSYQRYTGAGSSSASDVKEA